MSISIEKVLGPTAEQLANAEYMAGLAAKKGATLVPCVIGNNPFLKSVSEKGDTYVPVFQCLGMGKKGGKGRSIHIVADGNLLYGRGWGQRGSQRGIRLEGWQALGGKPVGAVNWFLEDSGYSEPKEAFRNVGEGEKREKKPYGKMELTGKVVGISLGHQAIFTPDGNDCQMHLVVIAYWGWGFYTLPLASLFDDASLKVGKSNNEVEAQLSWNARTVKVGDKDVPLEGKTATLKVVRKSIANVPMVEVIGTNNTLIYPSLFEARAAEHGVGIAQAAVVDNAAFDKTGVSGLAWKKFGVATEEVEFADRLSVS